MIQRRPPRPWRRWLAAAIIIVGACAIFATACNRQHATPALCGEILDRIIQIELTEQGFRDPALVARKQHELRRLLAPELAGCENRRVPAQARACLQRATTTEELSHSCLR